MGSCCTRRARALRSGKPGWSMTRRCERAAVVLGGACGGGRMRGRVGRSEVWMACRSPGELCPCTMMALMR
eukprot:365057-Chlamydomonas_euryale.AAC.7